MGILAFLSLIGLAPSLDATTRALQKEPAAGAVVNGLRLSLSADKNELLFKDGKIGGPAALKLTFTNVGDKPVKFNAYDFAWSRIKGELKAVPGDAATSARLAADRKLAPPVASDFFELKPGQSWSPGGRLAFPGAFPQSVGSKIVYEVAKPGEFRVRFKYSSAKIDSPHADGIWTGELSSNEVVVTAK